MTSWVRLWQDMPTDPKWRTIARKSGQRVGDVIALFTFLMVNAGGNALERGTLESVEIEDLATALDLDESDVRAILDAMQGKVLDGGKLRGWEKRQPKREDSTAAERKAAWKARQQNGAERTGTHRNAPDTDADADAEKKEKKEVTADAVSDYAFEGAVIRLKATDLDRWRAAYPDIGVEAQLQSRDDWLANEADEATRKKWFVSTSNHFAKLQLKSRQLAREREYVSPC